MTSDPSTPGAVGLYDAPLFREHDSGTGHPESPARLDAVRSGLRDAGLEDRLQPQSVRPATRDEILRVHARAHHDDVAASRDRTVRFDADTQASPRSYEAAMLAAGAVSDAVDQVLDGRLLRAFCSVRPPGHHALADRAMGFCLFNSVAVAAGQALERGLSRVLVIDFDVHHGNGTQAIFEDEPRVLYLSSHAYPFYPGTGGLDEIGSGRGRGFTVNLPMPAGLGDAEYVHAYRQIVLPVARAFDPELVIVSAGFDPYQDDPLAPMQVTGAGFGLLADVCLEAAAGAAAGRAVFALEGGYDPHGLALGAAAVVGRLLGDAPGQIPAETARGKRLVDLYREHLAPCWPVVR